MIRHSTIRGLAPSTSAASSSSRGTWSMKVRISKAPSDTKNVAYRIANKMKGVGPADHPTIATTARVLPIALAVASARLSGHLPTQQPHIAGAERQRHKQHQPAGRRCDTERIEAEGFEIEIDREHLGG